MSVGAGTENVENIVQTMSARHVGFIMGWNG